MRVLMVSANRETLPDPVAPLGAAYVASALMAAGHEVELLDLNLAQDVRRAVAEAVRRFRPGAAGVSIRNVDNVAFPRSVSYIPDMKKAVGALKEAGVGPIVLGGSGFTLMPRELLNALDLELGIVGEGEEAFPELLRRVHERLPVNDLPGLAYRWRGEARVNPPAKLTDLRHRPAPARSLIDNRAYMSEGGSGNIQTKRGCSFRCCYCTYPLVEGRRVRCRDAAASASEMEQAAAQHGITHFFVVDNVFNHPLAHAKAFCRELIKRGVPARWSCYLNPALVDEELVGLLARSGCRGVEFGADSAADEVLSALGKGFTASDVARASRLCAGAGLSFAHSLLIGSPGETAGSVRRTLDAMDRMNPNAVIAMLGIRVFPGTALERRARREGVLDGPVGLAPAFYFPPGFDIDRVLGYLTEFGGSHSNFIMPGINLRMTEKIRTTLRSRGFTGPLWEYLRPRPASPGAGR